VLYHLKINTRLLSFIIKIGISNLETISSYNLFANSGAFISVIQVI
jgi:hypothetical protein